MAAPVDSARVGTNITTASTSWAVNVGSPVAGTLLIVLVRFAAAPGAVTFTGYTQIASDASDATDDTTMVFYRWADGTEGTTDTLAPTNSVKGCAICWEITGAENPATQAPEISTVAVGTTAANSANPGSRSVTGGPKDVLYLALMGLDGEGNAPSAFPTNYANLVTANSGTAGAVATNCSIGGASRALTGSSSEDPGAFTHAAATTGWTAFTVAIHETSVIPVSDTITTMTDTLVRRVGRSMADTLVAGGGMVDKTWVFAGSAEGLADVGDSAITFQFDSGDGNSVDFVGAATGTQERARRASTGETWETWGVPAGQVVTSVQVLSWESRKWGVSGSNSVTIRIRIVDSSGATVHSAGDLIDQNIGGSPTDGAWVAQSAGSSRAVDSGKQASNTDVRIELEFSIPAASASWDVGLDDIALRITYGTPDSISSAFGKSVTASDTLATMSDSIDKRIGKTVVDTLVLGAIPTLTLIDDFNRANTGPPPSASWTNGILTAGGADGLVVLSNAMARKSSGPYRQGSYWNADTFGPDIVLVWDLSGWANTNGNGLTVYGRMATPGIGTTTAYGAELGWDSAQGAVVISLWRLQSGVPTLNVINPVLGTVAANDKLALVLRGPQFLILRQVGGTGPWTAIASGVDTALTSAGLVGFELMNNQVTRLDNLQVGDALVHDTVSSSRQRAMSDTLATVSDSLTSTKTRTRAISDTVTTMSDSVSSTRTRAISDTAVTPSDSVARTASFPRALTDTASTISDTLASRRVRALVDTLATISESVEPDAGGDERAIRLYWAELVIPAAGAAFYNRPISDTIATVSDSLVSRRSRALADTAVTSSDSLASSRTRQLTDTLATVTDSLTSSRSHSLSDTIATVTDSLASRRVRQLADTASSFSGDSITKTKIISRSLTDTAATLTDAITSLRARMLSDTLATIVDTPSAAQFRRVTDTLATITDALASLRNRQLTDTAATVTDALASRRVRVLTDTITVLDDSISTAGATARSATDTLVTHSDSIARTATHPRTASDTLATVSDSLVSTRTRSATDTLATVTDTLTSLRRRMLTDTAATVTDTLASRRNRQVSDTLVTQSDSIAVTRYFNRAITDTAATVTDSVSTGGATSMSDTLVTLTDSLTLRVTRRLTDTAATVTGDSITKAKVVSRTATDTIATVTDTLASRRVRMLSDQLATIVDTPSPAQFRSVTDTLVSFSETLRSSRSRSLSDTLATLTDALASLRKRMLTDTAATINDAISTAGATARSATDTLVNPGDSIARTATHPRVASDTLVTPSDSIALSRVRSRTVADTICTVTDSVSSSRSRTVTDTAATMTDSLTATSGIALLDTLAVISDSVTRHLGANRTITDTGVSFNDSLVGSKYRAVSMTDTAATVSDSLASRRIRPLVDTGAAMSDAIARSLQAYRFASDIALTMTDTITGTIITSPTDQLVAMSDTLQVNRVGRYVTDTGASFAIPDFIVFQAGTVLRQITDDILDMSDFIVAGANPTLYAPVGIVVADPFTKARVQDPDVEAQPVHDLIGAAT